MTLRVLSPLRPFAVLIGAACYRLRDAVVLVLSSGDHVRTLRLSNRAATVADWFRAALSLLLWALAWYGIAGGFGD